MFDSSLPCGGLIYVHSTCNESTANLDPTSLKSCDAVDLTWAYPMKILTITIETPYTQQHQPYTVSIDNTRFQSPTFQLYRMLNGHETLIKSPDNVVVEKSDSNYQVILKVQAPFSISLYLMKFGYKITKS